MLDPDERGEVIAHVSKSQANGSPGPAAYNISRTLEGTVPTIKMKSRHSMNTESNNAPYYKIPSDFGKTPRIHMGTRSKLEGSFNPPGPSYVPPPFGSDARGHSFSGPTKADAASQKPRKSVKSARRSKDCTLGPGPGAYNTRGDDFVANGKRGIRISGFHNFGFDDQHNPGPGTYRPRTDKILPSAPRYTIKGRNSSKRHEVTPGYRNIGSTLGGPRFTMKARATDEINII